MKLFYKLLIAFVCISQSLHAFTPLPFVKSTNIYEVNVRQYTPEGTFKAFAKHLPRLKNMGVKTIWFMPIQPIGIKNRKGGLGSYYSVQDYIGINPEYGNLQDFKNVVNQAHKLGIKVIIDWVANHTSWDNAWVTQHPEYYAKDSLGKMYSPFDWADVVQVDVKSSAYRDAQINCMQYWVKTCGIDGYRCDVAEFLSVDYWVETRKQVDKIKPLLWLAEASKPEYFKAFDILYGWEFLHKMEDYYKGKTNIMGLDSVMQNYYADYKNNKFRIIFTSNHDENSWSGTEYERLGASVKTFATMCATMPGVPLVYSGQEEAMNKRLRFFEKDTIGFKNYPLQKFYKNLLSGNGTFTTSKPKAFIEQQENVIVYPNKNKAGSFYALNLSNKPTKFIYLKKGDGFATLNIEGKGVATKNIKTVMLEAWGVKVIE